MSESFSLALSLCYWYVTRLPVSPLYRRKDEKGNPKIAVLLNDPATSTDPKGKRPAVDDGVPTEYRLTMQNTASKNMYVFGEKIEDDEETGEEGARKKRRKF